MFSNIGVHIKAKDNARHITGKLKILTELTIKHAFKILRSITFGSSFNWGLKVEQICRSDDFLWVQIHPNNFNLTRNRRKTPQHV